MSVQAKAGCSGMFPRWEWSRASSLKASQPGKVHGLLLPWDYVWVPQQKLLTLY